MSEVKINKLETRRKLNELMTRYYGAAKMSEGSNQKIAWITSGGPVEFLYAMDIIPIYPENHGAMCGITRKTPGLKDTAEELGYSRDLCSYATGDIGDAVSKKGPIMGLPKPDLLVCSNNICGTVTKWYEVLADMFDVPLVFLDTPFIHGHTPPYLKDYLRKQFDYYIAAIEQVTGKRFAHDRFIEVSRLSAEAVILWGEVLKKSAHKPAPLNCFDAFIHMAPIVTLRGTDMCVEYYKTLLAELDDRIAKGIGSIDNEKYRLLWDNIPIWYEMKSLFTAFASYGACLVADTYTNAWTFEDMNPDDPLESFSRAYSEVYLNLDLKRKLKRIKELAEIYQVQGLVLHSNRSCKPYSFGQLDIQHRIRKELGISTLFIEADMADSRCYSRAQTETRIQAFIESLG